MAKPPSGVRESVLNVSAVYLFGRLVSDLRVVGDDPEDGDRPPRKGANNFLMQQIRNNTAELARIYAFSFEGSLFELTRPSLFLVHGGGLDPDAPGPAGQFAEELRRLARSPGRISRTGVGRQSGSFSMDMKVWVYDKGDFSMRLDVETGTFEHILLDTELDDEAWASGGRSSGGRSSGGRSSGGRSSGGRSSGVMGRSSGWMPRRGGSE
jgi:hypothetical protein